MQTTVSSRITIAASPAEVFAYLANPRYHYLWSPHLLNISASEPLQLGSRYTAENRLFGVTLVAHNTVTNFLPPQEFAIENTAGSVKYELHFRLVDMAHKTRVHLSTTVSAELMIFKLTEVLLRELVLRELHTDLEALKVAAENHLA